MSGSIHLPGQTWPVEPTYGATQSAVGGLARLYDVLLAMTPGSNLAMVSLALFDAIEEFCTRSTAWRLTVAWTMAAGAASVDLNPIDTAIRAQWVLGVTGLSRFRLIPPAVLVDLNGSWSGARSGTALVVCKPVRLVDAELPDLLVNQWSEALREGALMRLYGQPNKPWSEPKTALFHGLRFRSHIKLARETARGHGDLPRPTFPYFATGSQGGGMGANEFGRAPGTSNGIAPCGNGGVRDAGLF